jgi:adenine-specific DNA-methyltransferase
LIAEIKATSPQLGVDLEREFQALSSRRPFGLNFERHVPESLELPGRSARRGDKVRILPPRGSTAKGDQRLWQVTKITADRKHADLELLNRPDSSAISANLLEAAKTTASLADLVVVAEFRDVIYPGLVSTGKVSSAGDQRPWHTVINGENYHVLKALTWTHRGKIDAIYIDPPYNTGAKDWKYNNDYVAVDDWYRHSKWLAMVERRLKLAKELLNPRQSVLVVTIDEKEFLRLGLLLKQTFEGSKIQMISSVISRYGTPRNREFTRVNEFIFIVMLGNASPSKTTDDMLFTSNSPQEQCPARECPMKRQLSQSGKRSPIWNSLRRLGAGPARSDSAKKFYPVLVDPATGRIIGAGEPLPPDVDKSTYVPPVGVIAVWPQLTDGGDGRWELKRSSFLARLEQGYVRALRSDKHSTFSIQYLRNAQLERLETGEIVDLGPAEDGSRLLEYGEGRPRSLYAKTVWNKPSHDARTYGTWILRELIPRRKFPFPKSLYAVEDVLRFFLKDKPHATVLDFFAGSGTTTHAVLRLNHQDGGRRRSIIVTNNEVSAKEAVKMRKKGLRPGDAEWDALGICEYITNPRVTAAITGKTPADKPVKGSYKFIDPFPMAEGFPENAEFFTLTYETLVAVRFQADFARIAPLLWLRAGSLGRRIEKVPAAGWSVADTYGLLVDLDKATDFLKAVRKVKGLRIVYIVTDDERRFQLVARRLPEGVEPIRLYESYLTNFAFANGD